jgi:hypothetical protein
MSGDESSGVRRPSSVSAQPRNNERQSETMTGSSNATKLNAADQDYSNDTTKPLAADMQQFIGRQLRAVYDDIAKQPVPDRFLELMKQLEGKSAAGG